MDWDETGNVVGVVGIFGSGNICSEKTEERTNGDASSGVMALNGHSEYEKE